jgi:hypothetical protein
MISSFVFVIQYLLKIDYSRILMASELTYRFKIMCTEFNYIGRELELFSSSSNWKNYYSSIIRKYIGYEVIEVGAGIGTTTQVLCDGRQKKWICLEPDIKLASQIQNLLDCKKLPNCCCCRVGTLAEVSHYELFDTIIYIDVLEHIDDDTNEISLASQHLTDKGILIVLSPAYQWLFSSFDCNVGHFRRYTRKSLSAIIPQELRCIEIMHLDSVGLLASLGNKLILRSKMPNQMQIRVWDKIMVPISKIMDFLLIYTVGRSIIGVWEKNVP